MGGAPPPRDDCLKQADPKFVLIMHVSFVNEYACGSGIYEVFDGRKVSPGSGWNCAFHLPTGNSYQQQSFNQGKPVPHVAWECSDLNCGRKRKHGNLDLLSGSLLDMLQQSQRLPHLKECSDNSEDVTMVKTAPLTMVSGSKFNSTIADDPTGSYEYITKRYESSIITTTKDKLKEPTEVPFEEKTNHENKEFNTVSDDYESSGNIRTTSVSSADCEMVPESENSETRITSFDNKNSGSGFGNIKTPSVPSVDIIMGSESENAETHITSCGTNSSGSGSKNMNIPSASMADLFTESQIKQHLSSFNQNNKAMWSENTEASSDQIPCHLCYDAVYLAPPPRYCSSCDKPIKKEVYYQSTDDENTNAGHCFCKPCFVKSCSISKGNLMEAMDVEKEEWVTCDRCHNWQHWICGLFNTETDKKKEADYICPKCRLTDIEDGKWVPQTLLRAKDLPRTNLSDHIEQRLFTRMKQEREEKAKSQGTELENVSKAVDLVVRVVVSVDKELEVKQQFRDIFGGKNYPEKLKYRTKLILLFQRLEGVDVCIFGMYVQEYGSECDGPNNRCVYISYLDSVKYFQPERKTASGESLRTFVYHEILIGYLEHCKKRGFATCYIWSCPLLNDQDYIFYSRPKTQKTPKEKKLRQWYELMLKKASNEGIVVGHNNLYDQFFVPKREENIKITTARLPYFDGAFWPRKAEALSKKIEEKESSGKLRSKSLNKRTLKALGQDNPTKDVLVMQQLGDKVQAKKKNLMIVHLQHMCTCCREVMLSGSRWFCNQCNKIQLCSRCFDSGKLLSAKKMHKCQSGKNTRLSEDVLSNVPRDTKDKDGLLMNSFFETQDDFLSKCENSQYQFITLGHAKYSSLMLLYHFTHKLVIKPVCTLCNNHALIDQCWHCDTCPNLYVCGSCYDTKGDTCHTHNLGHPSAKVTPEITKNKEEHQKQKVMTLNGALDALVHASRCRNIDCSYPDCQTIMRLLRHASRCSVRYAGGCGTCKQAWWGDEESYRKECIKLQEETKSNDDSEARRKEKPMMKILPMMNMSEQCIKIKLMPEVIGWTAVRARALAERGNLLQVKKTGPSGDGRTSLKVLVTNDYGSFGHTTIRFITSDICALLIKMKPFLIKRQLMWLVP
ncbi:putative histone acetyltransferase chromatin regulator PHD family protein [Tanacetum coccineum]